MLDDVTVCVTTFQRPRAVAKCVRTLNRMWPQLPVVVGDSSEQPSPLEGAEWVGLPFDCGVSAARNALLDRVTTRRVVLMDDDLFCTPGTRLDWLADTLDAGADLVGGAVPGHDGEPLEYHGLLSVTDGVLRYEHGHRGFLNGLPVVDVVLNLFMADTGKLRAVGWDPVLKIAEHTDFFLRAKEHGLVVVFDDRVTVGHRSPPSPGYSQFRGRGPEFVRLFWDKWGIREAFTFEGKHVLYGDLLGRRSAEHRPSRVTVRLLNPVGRRPAGDVISTTRQQAEAWVRNGSAELNDA